MTIITVQIKIEVDSSRLSTLLKNLSNFKNGKFTQIKLLEEEYDLDYFNFHEVLKNV